MAPTTSAINAKTTLLVYGRKCENSHESIEVLLFNEVPFEVDSRVL
jgi:hypothetical protein